MAIDSQTGRATIEDFLSSWPIAALDTMSIEQYANLQDRNAFCYWLEYGSRDLGEIGGIPLTKFGLWKSKNHKDFSETFKSDNGYAWNGKYGNTPHQAFSRIKSTVKDIAEAASRGDFEQVESIEFHAIAKWKIAFFYSNNQIVPVYTREGLLKITSGLGGRFPEDARIVDLQNFICSKKPAGENMIDYARHLWDHYVKGKPFRNYFIVGTKYKDENGNDTKDVFPNMLTSNTVAIGFLYHHNLSHLVGASDEEINSYIETNLTDEISLSRVQSYFRYFLNLKPGDIIALKSQGAYGNLEIIGYAVVTQRNGSVYEHRPADLGHHVNVEFVELNVNRKTGLNYAGTLHKIDSDKHDHLLKIFGPFLQVDNIAFGDNSDNDDNSNLKSEDSYVRGPIAERIVRQLHNILQNSLFNELKRNYPNDKITMEYEGRIDILRESETERWFYEVKPFENVVYCLRNAIGQLIEYAFRFQDNTKSTRLVIVGPGELKGEAVSYLDHYDEHISYPIEYLQHLAPSRQGQG